MNPSLLPSTPSFRLDGKRALVTGAGRGIGLGAAAALASAGANVTLCARTESELNAAVSAIRERGGDANALILDITDLEATQNALLAREPYDVFVSNAGTNCLKGLLEVTPDDFQSVFDLNVRAAYFLAQAIARPLIHAGRGGSIIHISSQLGHMGATNRSLYVASKFAIEGLTKALATELGPKGIRVNAIAPTFVDTPLTRSYNLDAAALEAVRARIKLGRTGRVEDIMGAVVFLASEASSLVTGTSLLADGGWTAG